MSPRGVVLFPGAGTSADHPSLVAVADALAPVPTARLDFPYRLAGRRAPDRAPVLVASVKTGVRAFAADLDAPTSSLVIGGRSMGGRMCSMAVADDEDPLPVCGLVLVAYPLAAPKKPDAPRIAHLPGITVPVLCVSGTRDAFGSPEALRRAFDAVPGPVEWHFVEGARHDLKGADDEVAGVVREWVSRLGSAPRR